MSESDASIPRPRDRGHRRIQRTLVAWSTLLPLLLVAGLPILAGTLAVTTLLGPRAPAGATTLPTVVSVTGGVDSAYAVTAAGNVYAWGYNSNGILGVTADAPSSTEALPGEVSGVGGVGFLSGVTQVVATGLTTYALNTTGNVFAWGYGGAGELGNGTTTSAQSTPVEVQGVGGVGYLSGVTQVFDGGFATYALTASGNVYAWGDAIDGSLGNGATSGSQTTPVEVEGVGGVGNLSGISSLATGPTLAFTGTNATYALSAAGNVYAWGAGSLGALGNGTTTSAQATPVEVQGAGGSGFLSGVVQVETGASSESAATFAVTSSGNVYGWGAGDRGELGNGGSTDIETTPVEVEGVSGTGVLSGVTQMASSFDSEYAIGSGGHVYAWGGGAGGELGNGATPTGQSTPVEVLGVGGSGTVSGVTTVVSIESPDGSGERTAAALTSSGHIYMWGEEGLGELGNGTQSVIQTTPVEVEGVGGAGFLSNTSALGASEFQPVALGSSGDVYMWGSAAGGALGDGTTSGGQTTPFPVGDLGPGSFYSVVPQGAAPGADMQGGGSATEPACQCTTGRPVNLANGDYYDTTTDLTVPGAGVPLNFSRTYDAYLAQQQAASSAPTGPLGYGWSDSLNVTLSYLSGVVTLTEGNGAQDTYYNYAVGAPEPAWCPSDASASVFCPSAPRFLATLSQNAGAGTWTFTNDLKSPLTYTLSGTTSATLTSIRDASGDTLSSAPYSPSGTQLVCPSGDSCTVWSSVPAGSSTPSGELVEAVNTTTDLLDEVFNPNTSDQIASYAYSGSGCSSWSGGHPDDLCRELGPGGVLQTAYTYDSSNTNASLQYDELTMSPPTGGDLTNVYNAAGQMTQQTTTSGGTSQVMQLSYANNASLMNGSTTTVTTYPNGLGGSSHVVTYQFSNNVLVGDTDGTGATTYIEPDLASLLPQEKTDGNGYTSGTTLSSYADGATSTSSGDVLASTDALGNTTQYQYTAANQVWCTIDPADTANGTVCPATQPTAPPTPGSDPYPGAVISIFNAADQVTATTDALGNTSLDAYTSGVSGVPDGLLYCTVDPANYRSGVTCPAYGAAHVTGTVTKTYNAAGYVLTSTDANGNTTSYTYGDPDHPGLATVTTDPDGNATTVTYDSSGHVLTSTESFNGYTSETVNAYSPATGLQYCQVSPLEVSNGVTCPTSPPTSPPTGTPGYTDTIYNSAGQPILVTSPIDGTTQYAYDGEGYKYCTVTPRNYASGTRCPSLPLTVPTPSSDLYLGATIDTFDADGRVVQETDPIGGIALTTYDPDGNVEQTTKESTNGAVAPNVVTTKVYDAADELVSSTVDQGSSLAQTTLNSYDPDGNVFCSVSPNAVAAGSSAYQCPSWLATWIQTPPNPSSEYSSTPSATQANNVTLSFANADGNQEQSTNADGDTTTTVFDPSSRVYCSIDSTNMATYLGSHPTATYPYSCPAPSTAPPSPGSNPGFGWNVFDANGNVTTSSDPDGNTTTTSYDPDGKTLVVTDPNGHTTTNCFYWQNASGLCAHSAPAAGGAANDLYSTTTPPTSADPTGELTTTTYLPNDLTDAKTNPAGTTTDFYDAAGDLTSVTYSGTAGGYSTPSNLGYSYNSDGTRHAMTDSTGTTTYSYDAAGDVSSQALVAAGGLSNTTTSYAYLASGLVSSITYPAYGSYSSPQVTYVYDGTGSMISEDDWLGKEVAFSHDADGNSTTQANAVSTSNPAGTSSTTTSYDFADYATAVNSSMAQTCGGSETLTQSFSGSGGSRNADGQVTSDSDTYTGSCSAQPSYQRDYTYDPAGRVTYQGTAPQGSSANTFGYDSGGDPTTISSHDSAGAFDTYTQAFDNAGEVTGQTPVSGSAGVATTYGYDTLGGQTTATTPSSVNTGTYDQAGHLTGSTLADNASVTALAAGNGQTYAMRSDGTVWAAGNNYNGQLGDGSTTSSTSPVKVTGLSGISGIAAGNSDGLALRSDGTVWAWGFNNYGQLGDGTTTDSHVPVQVSGLPPTKAIADGLGAASLHSLAIDDNNTVWSWGYNAFGQLGNGTTTNSSLPVHVSGLSNVMAVAGGADHSLALDSSGNVWAWGYNAWGQLGNGTTTNSSTPIELTGLPHVVAISASGFQSFALDSSGHVWAWGQNTFGQLGDGSTTSSSTPVELSISSPIASISAGNSQTLARTSSGSVWSWGDNSYGDLGDGTTTQHTSPENPSTIGAMASLSAGGLTSTAIDASGTVWVWGYNYWGEFGDGTTGSTNTTPVSTSFSSTTSSTTYKYNGDGLEASASTAGSLKQFTWDMNGGMANILSDGANDYIYGPAGEPVEQVNTTNSPPPNNPTFMSYTPSDSSWTTTNAAGDETGFYRYDAFGNLAYGDPTTPFGYAGQYADVSTGFANMRARWYEPQAGTFTTRDPAFASTDQAYEYAGDDPVNKGDPEGNFTLGICGNAAAGAAALIGVSISGQACLVRTVFDQSGEDDIGITETFGYSVLGAAFYGGAGVSYQVSDAVHLQDLAHWYYSVDVSAQVGPGLSGSFFWGKGASGSPVYGINGGISLGGGFAGLFFTTNTWVQQAHGGGLFDWESGLANTLRGIWDALVPSGLNVEANLYSLTARSRTASRSQGTTKSQGGQGMRQPLGQNC